MTKCVDDVKAQVRQYCSSVHFLELDRPLSKLDNTDLELLHDLIELAYETGIENAY